MASLIAKKGIILKSINQVIPPIINQPISLPSCLIPMVTLLLRIVSQWKTTHTLILETFGLMCQKGSIRLKDMSVVAKTHTNE